MTTKLKLALVAGALIAGTFAVRRVLPDRDSTARASGTTPVAADTRTDPDRTHTQPQRSSILPVRSTDLDSGRTSEIQASPNDDLPDLTTVTMESVTDFDRDGVLDGAVSGLLNGAADLGAFATFAVGVVGKAKLIAASSQYREVKPVGKRRWIVYRAIDGRLCRAAVERFVAPDGDSKMFKFAAPFATSRIANAPRDCSKASVQLELFQVRKDGSLRGSMDLGLVPDVARANGIGPYWALIEFQGKSGCGKTLSFIETGGRLLTQMVDYPRIIGPNATEAVDVDWSFGRPTDESTSADARRLAAAIDALMDR